MYVSLNTIYIVYLPNARKQTATQLFEGRPAHFRIWFPLPTPHPPPAPFTRLDFFLEVRGCRRHLVDMCSQDNQSIVCSEIVSSPVQSSPVPVLSCPVLSAWPDIQFHLLSSNLHNYVCMKASPALPENLPRSACHFCVRCLVLVMKKRTSVLRLSTYLTQFERTSTHIWTLTTTEEAMLRCQVSMSTIRYVKVVVACRGCCVDSTATATATGRGWRGLTSIPGKAKDVTQLRTYVCQSYCLVWTRFEESGERGGWEGESGFLA